MASDPEGAAPAYSIERDNAAGLFATDAGTGALFYTVAGEDYESGATSHAPTARASDGSLHDDVAVNRTRGPSGCPQEGYRLAR